MKIKNSLKTYNHIDIVTRQGVKYIKKKISKDEQLFYAKARESIDNVILYPAFQEKDYAFFPYYPKGNIVGKNKELFIAAIKGMAEIHHVLNPKEFEFLSKSTQQSYQYELTELKVLLQKDPVVNMGNMDCILEALESSLPDITFDSIIHEDFIALNVLDGDGIVKIIDWAYVKIDFAERDPGRFIGDLFYKNTSFENRYYPFSYRTELINAYLMQRQLLNPDYQIDKGYKRILLGEILNYMNPITSCLKKNTLNDWYKANLNALLRSWEKTKTL